jgi:hypothetical protein
MNLESKRITQKSECRIFVTSEEHKLNLIYWLKQLDPDEFDYFDNELIKVCSLEDIQNISTFDLLYSGKYEMDTNLIYQKCLELKIPVWVYFNKEY